jgi:hypothetical protein
MCGEQVELMPPAIPALPDWHRDLFRMLLSEWLDNPATAARLGLGCGEAELHIVRRSSQSTAHCTTRRTPPAREALRLQHMHCPNPSLAYSCALQPNEALGRRA